MAKVQIPARSQFRLVPEKKRFTKRERQPGSRDKIPTLETRPKKPKRATDGELVGLTRPRKLRLSRTPKTILPAQRSREEGALVFFNP
jgi:hypothetical protein